MSGKGGILLPALAFAGTATACAILTYNLASQYYAEQCMNRYRERSPQEKEEEHEKNAATVENDSTKPTKAEVEQENELDQLSRKSSMLMVMLLQDGFMLFALLGVGLMVLVVLVSLALVMANDGVHSPIQLQMFAPLMYVSIGMILVGMINSMLRNRKPKPHAIVLRPESPKNMKKTSVIFEDEKETEPKATKRKSKCPFGFG